MVVYVCVECVCVYVCMYVYVCVSCMYVYVYVPEDYLDLITVSGISD